ncbi:NB-ARC domain-containing protein [Kitasatospora sp. SUK 42]|uniref:NB-ARC domain-containing protein n=1 Tax=Kitasatospora sp. SUK 42 TaxID=1588882 RepID=UPI0018C9EC43|nr:NB-ARC domain-containing protein [Kitasatospora sp. SUK 42]MBV2151523.1 hypothetical protein [Kitasatospora sp. SUK 42]
MPDPIRNNIDGGVYGPLIQAGYVNGVPTGGAAGGAPTRQARWPKQVGVVPELADAYQSRGVDLDPAGASTVVLTGMLGSGKTQLAARYAHTRLLRGYVDFVLWVRATDRRSVEEAYIRAAAELDLPAPADPERLRSWLRTTDRRWLVVLDDVSDPADLRALWPPVTARGRTLVTTRRRDPSLRMKERQVLEVGPFRPVESLAYLVDRLTTHGLGGPADQLAALADDVDHLPLALSLASAYLIDRADTGVTASDYRARLAEHRPLAELAPDPDGSEQSVAEILADALTRADAATGALATPVLQLASVLDPEGVPVDVLTSEPARMYLAGASAEAVDETLRTLHRLSLVTRTHDLLRVHRLIQWAAHDSLPSASRRAELVELAALALTTAWTTGPLDRETVRIRRANHRALTARHPEVSWGASSGTLAVLEQAADLLDT